MHPFVYTYAPESRPSPFQGVCRIDTHTGKQDIWMGSSQQFMGVITHLPVAAPEADSSSTADSSAAAGVNGSSSSSSKGVNGSASDSGDDAAREDDTSGYVVGICTNGATLTSELLVFSAANIAAGPICR